MRATRGRAGAVFALAGAAAAAVHVAAETDGTLREWRQALPLAAALGFALGVLLRPRGPARGALAALGGMAGFALLFGIGHAAIEAARGASAPLALALEGVAGAGAAMAGPGGLAALAAGAAAGAALARGRTGGGRR